MLSLTTDYVADVGNPEPYLRRIADAGFSHVHWCHQWDTDFLYARPEIDRIAAWLRDFGLTLCDLHASAGVEKVWGSLEEYVRQAGVELVANRLEMTARLGGDVIVLHLCDPPSDPALLETYWDQTFKSLEELERPSKGYGVRIALENGDFAAIRRVFDLYGPASVGLCYDCGHGNLIPDGLDQLEDLRRRLIAVHLHDNDGTRDQHKLPFSGTVDWDRLAKIMARSSYKKCVSMESNMRGFGYTDEAAFLKEAYVAGMRLTAMIEAERRIA